MATNPSYPPCGAFPPSEFFAQNKLETEIAVDYEYTRSFIIYATSSQTGVLQDDLVINVMPVDEAESGLGTPKGTGTTWQDQLKKLLLAKIPPLPRTSGTIIEKSGGFRALSLGSVRTSLDFTLQKKSCILIRLIGDFWGFSRTMSPVTTKYKLDGKHYYNLEKHQRWDSTTNMPVGPGPNADYRCVSFFSKVPCIDEDNIRHGFSFNIDLIMVINNKEERLPITVDPDIENKGGNG